MTRGAATAAPISVNGLKQRQPLPPAVVIHHGLAAFALETGHVPEYRLYVVARERLHAGRLRGRNGLAFHRRNGGVEIDGLIGALCKLPGAPLGDRRNIRKALQDGDGTYWDIAGGKLRFPSPDALAARLGLPCAGHRLTAYPVATVGKGAAAFRDLLRDALQPSAPARLARVTQAARLHTSASTQKRREAAGKALYHDGAGQAPVATKREWVNFTTMAQTHVSVAESARNLQHEGFFARTSRADGTVSLWRQLPKTYQSSRASKRRRPSKPCSGHQPSGYAPGTRLLSYCGSKTARVALHPSDQPRLFEAIPRGGALSVEDYLAARPPKRSYSENRGAERPSLPGLSTLGVDVWPACLPLITRPVLTGLEPLPFHSRAARTEAA